MRKTVFCGRHTGWSSISSEARLTGFCSFLLGRTNRTPEEKYVLLFGSVLTYPHFTKRISPQGSGHHRRTPRRCLDWRARLWPRARQQAGKKEKFRRRSVFRRWRAADSKWFFHDMGWWRRRHWGRVRLPGTFFLFFFSVLIMSTYRAMCVCLSFFFGLFFGLFSSFFV